MWEEMICTHTPVGADPNSIINPVLVLSSDRANLELEQTPEVFRPITGPLKMRRKRPQYLSDFYLGSQTYTEA